MKGFSFSSLSKIYLELQDSAVNAINAMNFSRGWGPETG